PAPGSPPRLPVPGGIPPKPMANPLAAAPSRGPGAFTSGSTARAYSPVWKVIPRHGGGRRVRDGGRESQTFPGSVPGKEEIRGGVPPVTILCVDDDKDIRRAFTVIFRRAGFAVKEAATGSDALRLVAERPDLVVLDVHLPDINGLEVCR